MNSRTIVSLSVFAAFSVAVMSLAYAGEMTPAATGLQAAPSAVAHPATTGISSGAMPALLHGSPTPRPALSGDIISLGADDLDPERPSAPGFCTVPRYETAEATADAIPAISGC